MDNYDEFPDIFDFLYLLPRCRSVRYLFDFSSPLPSDLDHL